MLQLLDIWGRIEAFFESGGDIVPAIFVVTLIMWMLILERLAYFRFAHRKAVARALERWLAREDQTSWYAHQIRRLMISEIDLDLHLSLPMIRTLVAICPLLGLLGTVTGMIEVFDVMAVAGNANPRAMASGVTKATIPTMAGMVAALSGLALSVQLERYANQETERVADHLTHS